MEKLVYETPSTNLVIINDVDVLSDSDTIKPGGSGVIEPGVELPPIPFSGY